MSGKKTARLLVPVDTKIGRIDTNALVTAPVEMIEGWEASGWADTSEEGITFCTQELGAVPVEID